jgi:hypothetical protein
MRGLLDLFLNGKGACSGGRDRASGFRSIGEAWEKCHDGDLVWALNRCHPYGIDKDRRDERAEIAEEIMLFVDRNTERVEDTVERALAGLSSCLKRKTSYYMSNMHIEASTFIRHGHNVGRLLSAAEGCLLWNAYSRCVHKHDCREIFDYIRKFHRPKFTRKNLGIPRRK